MKLQDVNQIQSANKLIRQWNSVRAAASPPARIVLQAQGPGHTDANIVVMPADPEFVGLWATFKAIVERKYTDSARILSVAGVDSPDVAADVKAALAK